MEDHALEFSNFSNNQPSRLQWGERLDVTSSAKNSSTGFNNSEVILRTDTSATEDDVAVTLKRKALKGAEIDASVLIRIIKHCGESFPTPVNGLLLGLDRDDTLEITDCFGLLYEPDLWNQLSREKVDSRELDEKAHIENQRYQIKMLEQLSMVNADCCTVGWYQTLLFNDLKDSNIVEALCEHQTLIREALCIGFDPSFAHLGADAFKVFRVSDDIVAARAEQDSSDVCIYNKFQGKEILVEVPLYIRSSLLVQAFLNDWVQSNPNLRRGHASAILQESSRQPDSLHESLGFILGCLDDFQLEQEKLIKYQKEYMRQQQKQRELAERRRIENEQRRLRNEEPLPEISMTLRKVGEPSQLPILLMCNQVKRVSSKLNHVIGDTLSRSYLKTISFS